MGRQRPPPRDGYEERQVGRGRKKRTAAGANAFALDDEGSGDEELDVLGVPLDSVVKVQCVHSKPNFSLPWQRHKQVRSISSGFCINKERRAILTNAHCIEWHAQVKVQRRGSDVKHLAKVVSVGWECDCAVLTVEDDEFWEGMKVVQLCEKVPHLEEAVLCVGFPVGGDTMSVTSGVVSRIEVMNYAQTCTELLGIQIDAAINDGNSGGPAFNNAGECLGMAFQSMSGAKGAENIGYVIPTVVIMHFLMDVLKHGKYTGFPTLGLEAQTLENSHQREAYGLTAAQKGILVSRLPPTAAAAKVLKPGDVLLAFDGHPIANDSTVSFRKHERVSYTWLVAQKFYGEAADLSILRDGKVMDVHIKDFHPESSLIPVHLFNQPSPGPSYLIVAGLVFTTLSVPFFRAEFGEAWECEAPVDLVHAVVNQRAEFVGHSLVVLTQLLAHDLTVGYEDLETLQLRTVNSTPVRNLKHVAELVDGCSDPYLRFGLGNTNYLLVLRTDEAKKATAEVLEQHSIPAAMSPDLAGQQPASSEKISAESQKAQEQPVVIDDEEVVLERAPSRGSKGSPPEKPFRAKK